ncbi:hypothetical protein QBC40DRAFT_165268 [Triangularia verruculosa]|uniref:Transmembrane protein n=1 Tax=Triangularia verruculosa TaxID=2587418 RepID=A0AAN6XRH2_9PEZI|nr:hypothetical protein QBC40DRAFT_165268 [Triangularia verruculosa]
MRPRAFLLLVVSSGLALCAPNPNPSPRPVAGPEADPNIDGDGNQITLTSEAYYGSDAGVSAPNDPPGPRPSQSLFSPPLPVPSSDPPSGGNSYSVKATTSTDDGKRLKYLDREGVEEEYESLRELKEKLRELEEKVKEREEWFKEVICPKEPKEKGECASPLCVFGKVFTTAASGLKRRGVAGERCWEGTDKKEFPLPPWRGGRNETDEEERRAYNPPKWIRVLNSGVLEVLVIVLGVGLAVLTWGLMRDGRQEADEERQYRRGCCGFRWRQGRQEADFEEREKLTGFGEHENAENQEEELQFEIGSESGSEDEVTGVTTYDLPRPHYQQREEAERRIQTWATEPAYESETEGMVADGIYGPPRPHSGQADREQELRNQDLAARQRYAPSDSESDTLAGTRSPSEVDSLEGVSMSQELASWRDAFGMVEDLVARVEQRRRQI